MLWIGPQERDELIESSKLEEFIAEETKRDMWRLLRNNISRTKIEILGG